MRRWLRRLGVAALFLVIGLCLAIVCGPPFLDRVYYRGPASDHFDGARFRNPLDAPAARGGAVATARFLAGPRPAWPAHVAVVQTRPPARVAGRAMRVTWIGHATVLVQTDGLNILTDPIWSDYAAPLPLPGFRRVAAPGVRFTDLPRIDLVLVSHNHFDHMDLATLRRLWARDRPRIVTSLGNDAILAGAGVPSVARDWGGRVPIRPGVTVIVERVHHWSTRTASDRNRALWSGFTVTLPGGNLFFAGDTAWGDGRWPDAVAARGPIRLALIPIGAFLPREAMADHHLAPQEAVALFRRIGARSALGIHWGTFHLAHEAYDAPPLLLAGTLKAAGIAPGRFRTTAPGAGWMVP